MNIKPSLCRCARMFACVHVCVHVCAHLGWSVDECLEWGGKGGITCTRCAITHAITISPWSPKDGGKKVMTVRATGSVFWLPEITTAFISGLLIRSK